MTVQVGGSRHACQMPSLSLCKRATGHRHQLQVCMGAGWACWNSMGGRSICTLVWHVAHLSQRCSALLPNRHEV